MDSLSIDQPCSRILQLNSVDYESYKGSSVVYVMSRDQRLSDNPALREAQVYALERKLPLAVVFCLREGGSHRSREHYEWMIEGLKELESNLASFNIPFMLLIGDPEERILGLANHLDPAAVFFDMNPLRGPRKICDNVASIVKCPVFLVDAHNLVPVWVVSDKQEYGARTIRPKIHRQASGYLIEEKSAGVHPYNWPGVIMPISDLAEKIETLLTKLPSNGQKNIQKIHSPGESAALQRLQHFLKGGFLHFEPARNDPNIDALSGLSPYLHFGQISSRRAILEAQRLVYHKPELQKSYEALFEEMIVRKELSDNYCYYNQRYDSLDGAPDWAIKTLHKRSTDRRDFIYEFDQFRDAKTHDNAWNAAQNQLTKTGKMHGYMRMYWAKKVLEWSDTPQSAIKTLIELNDFYSIDGGDPNGYVGILWSVAGLHDRPWGERPVYGTIRSMVYGGLKRKFDIKQYEETWL